MKRLVIFTICLLVALPLISAGQDRSQDRAEFEERIKLDLYLVDVVVVDEKGNYVNGLTAEDFKVYEDGKLVTIDSVDEFYSRRMKSTAEMAGEQLADSAPPRNIIIIIDRFFSSGYSIKQAKEAVSRFAQENLQENDRVMLMTFDREFTIHQDFTTNHALLQSKVETINAASKSLYTPEFLTSYSSRADSQMNLSTQNPNNRQIETASVDTFQNVRFEQDVRKYYESLRQLATALKSVPGRKTVVLLSEGYDSRIVSDARGSFDSSRNATNRVLADELPTADTGTATGGIPNRSTLFNVYGNTLSKINDAATSFYVVDIASLESQTSRTDVFEERSFSKNYEYDNARLSSLSTLASNTGGKLYKNIRNLDKVIDDINYDISNYYIIGYRSDNTRQEGEFREIRVEAAIPGVEVRHREGFFERKQFSQMPATEQFVHLVEGFFRTSPENEFVGRSTMFFLPIDMNTIVASLAVEIPYSELKGKHEKTVEFIGQILDSSNNRIDAFHKVLDYSNHTDQLQSDQELSLKIPFVLKSGANKVRVIVRNNATGKRFYHFEDYNVIGSTPDELSLSSLVLVDPSDANSSVEKYGMRVIDKGRDTGYEGYRVIDPLRATVGTPLFPLVQSTVKTGKTAVAFFSAANYWQDKNSGSVNFYIDYVLVDLEGNEYRIPVGEEKFIPVPGTRRINVLSELDFTDIKPGEYDLTVRFLDRELLQGLKRTVQLTVK